MYTVSIRMQKDHTVTPLDSSPCRRSVDCGNTKITQHSLKSFTVFIMLKLNTIRMKNWVGECEDPPF